jgi:hypothetical protein
MRDDVVAWLHQIAGDQTAGDQTAGDQTAGDVGRQASS